MKDHKYISKEKRPNYTYYEYPSKGNKNPKISATSEIELPKGYKTIKMRDEVIPLLEFAGKRALTALGFMLNDAKTAHADPLYYTNNNNIINSTKNLDYAYKDLNKQYQDKHNSLRSKDTNSNNKKNYYSEMRTKGPK